MPQAEVSRSVTVDLPDGWFAVDPGTSPDKASIRTYLDHRIADFAQLRPLREPAIQAILQFAHDATSDRTLQAGLYIGSVGGAPVVATLTISSVPLKESGTANPRTLAIEVGSPQVGDVGLRDVGIVELPAGAAVRVRYLVETGPDAEGSAGVWDVLQDWLPIAGGSEVVVVDLRTPSLPYADTLIEEFEAITEILALRT